jgi:DNA-directed RNA polymerase specialized sigma subunit, sigma24 homolog
MKCSYVFGKKPKHTGQKGRTYQHGFLPSPEI